MEKSPENGIMTLPSYGEILAPHYTKGGLPGYYPPIKGKRPELIFNLYDPFNARTSAKFPPFKLVHGLSTP